jgi:predicted DsbA family dithiol-disulfide isomerase
MPNDSQDAAKPLTVIVFGDFICPYSYIAQDQMDELARNYNVELLWRPHWLHPEVPPEGAQFPRDSAPQERRERTLAWLKEMAPERAESIRFPEKIQCSLFAFEALEFAQDRGLALPFTSAVFDALWVEGMDIGQLATLQAAAAKVGLDPEALEQALLEQKYRKRVYDSLQLARDAGIVRTPTFLLGRYRVVGWHYYEVFQTVMEKQAVLPRTESVPPRRSAN